MITLNEVMKREGYESVSLFLKALDLQPAEPHYRDMITKGEPITPFMLSALQHKYRSENFDHLLDPRYSNLKKETKPVEVIKTEVKQEPVKEKALRGKRGPYKQFKGKPTKRSQVKEVMKKYTDDVPKDFKKIIEDAGKTLVEDAKRDFVFDREPLLPMNGIHPLADKQEKTPFTGIEPYLIKESPLVESNQNWFGFAEKMPDVERVIIIDRDGVYEFGVAGFGATYHYPKQQNNNGFWMCFYDLTASDLWAYLPQ